MASRSPAHVAELLSDLPQDGRTLQVVERSPAILIGLRAGDRQFDVGFGGLLVPAHHDARPGRIDGFHDLSVASHRVAGNVQGDLRRVLRRVTLPAGDEFLGPVRVLHQRKVGVRLVPELLPGMIGRHRRGRGLPPILGTARRIRDGGLGTVRGDEFGLQSLPVRAAHFQLERVPQKIVGTGVLIQSPHEITDRVDEVLPPAGRGIQQQPLTDLEQGAPLVIGHSLQHFELHELECVILQRQDQGKRDLEQVVRGDPQAHRRRFSGRNPSTSIRLKFASVSSFDL